MPLNILLLREEGVEVEGATNGDLYTSPSGSLLTEQYVDIPFLIALHSRSHSQGIQDDLLACIIPHLLAKSTKDLGHLISQSL